MHIWQEQETVAINTLSDHLASLIHNTVLPYEGGRTTSENNCTFGESSWWSTFKHTNPRRKTLFTASLPLPTPTGHYHSWATLTAFVCVSNTRWEKDRCSRATVNMHAWKGKPLLDIKAFTDNFHHILRKTAKPIPNMDISYANHPEYYFSNMYQLSGVSNQAVGNMMYLFGVLLRRYHRFIA